VGVSAADVAALANLAGLEVPAEYREGVAIQLTAVQAQAQLVMDLELDEGIEPAPVFRP
jgi:hypothetical protein